MSNNEECIAYNTDQKKSGLNSSFKFIYTIENKITNILKQSSKTEFNMLDQTNFIFKKKNSLNIIFWEDMFLFITQNNINFY